MGINPPKKNHPVVVTSRASSRLATKNELDSQFDEVLSIMQQKLDNLCEQVNYFKAQPIGGVSLLSMKSDRVLADEASDCENMTASSSRHSFSCSVGSSRKISGDHTNILHAEHLIHNGAQQEERRLSGQSDWGSRATSSSDFQLVSLEQDLQSLRQHCEEKDAMIHELSQRPMSVEATSSKRIAELEDVIRRKNTRVSKLQKDMQYLEQKVMQLTRAKRPSTSNSTLSSRKVPLMSENVLYGMDSTTSPSSDSDCSRDNESSMVTRKECIPSETELTNSQ